MDPSNIGIERTIIATLLRDNSVFDSLSKLKPNDFFLSIHQTIFQRITDRIISGLVADIMTINIDDLDIDPSYLNALVSEYFTTKVEQYADILIELSKRRKLLNVGKTIVENALDENVSIYKQINAIETTLLNLNSSDNISKTQHFFDGVVESLQLEKQKSYETRYTELDKIIGGFHGGELIILAGRPSTGKTALATNITWQLVQQKYPVLIISLEMSCEQICARLVALSTKVDLSYLLHGKIPQHVVQSCIRQMEKFKSLPLFINDASSMNIMQIRSLLMQSKRQHDIKCVVIDYLQLIESYGENREQEISKISRALKLLAKELNVPILALSQLSREVEKRKDDPKSSDLRGSGAIEQDADVIFILSPSNTGSVIKCFVVKNRNGPLGQFSLFFDRQITEFRNLAKPDTMTE
jgi:replicative DNA helicase